MSKQEEVFEQIVRSSMDPFDGVWNPLDMDPPPHIMAVRQVHPERDIEGALKLVQMANEAIYHLYNNFHPSIVKEAARQSFCMPASVTVLDAEGEIPPQVESVLALPRGDVFDLEFRGGSGKRGAGKGKLKDWVTYLRFKFEQIRKEENPRDWQNVEEVRALPDLSPESLDAWADAMFQWMKRQSFWLGEVDWLDSFCNGKIAFRIKKWEYGRRAKIDKKHPESDVDPIAQTKRETQLSKLAEDREKRLAEIAEQELRALEKRIRAKLETLLKKTAKK